MHGSSQHFQETIRHSDAIRHAAENFSARLDWQGRMNRCPVATMATAMALGYVLGGGLFTRFTARIMKIGSRWVLVPMLRNKAKGWMRSWVEESGQTESRVTM